jgi:hypothetical protein
MRYLRLYSPLWLHEMRFSDAQKTLICSLTPCLTPRSLTLLLLFLYILFTIIILIIFVGIMPFVRFQSAAEGFVLTNASLPALFCCGDVDEESSTRILQLDVRLVPVLCIRISSRVMQQEHH